MTAQKTGRVSRALLLLGMGLAIPCYLFTVFNVTLSPWPLYERSRPLLLLLTALCTAGLLLLMRCARRLAPFVIRHERAVLAAAACFYLAVQLVMACVLRFEPKTDAEQCFTAAQLLVDRGTFGDNERSFIYFTRYPHNLGLVYALAGIFRFFGLFGWGGRFMQAVLVASLLFTLGLLASAQLCKRLGGALAQTRVLLLFATCLPFLYCTTELYTDCFSLAFPPVILLCALRAQDAATRGGRVRWALLFGLASFVGAQLRFTSVIAAAAALLALLFSRRWRQTALCALALALAFALGGAAMDAETARHLSDEDIEKNELPKLHYIAMGLPVQEDQGYGQYGDGGWLIFTTSFDDPKERDAALLEQVIDRVYTLRYPSRLLNLLSRKNLSTFGNGTFKLNEIIEADAYEPDNAVKQVVFEQGALFPAYYHLTTALFLSQMLLMCLSCARALRRRDASCASVFITLVGAFLFLCMWETRARYFFQFEMVLLCAGALLPEGRAKRGYAPKDN